MHIDHLQTPAILLEADVLARNIHTYAARAAACGKELWPMVKTHKSLALARAQRDAGAAGFLCGTLDEAEALCDAGFDNLMYAYPVATEVSIRRVIDLVKKCRFTVRLDGFEAAEKLHRAAKEAGVTVDYTLIIDSGLHRFGVAPEAAGAMAMKIAALDGLRFVGVSGHPGHVYGACDRDGIARCTADECAALGTAKASLEAAGFTCQLVTSGSTPTFFGAAADENITVYHPGNYVFMDAIQVSTGTAAEDDCALSVLASVIAHPREDLFICDAGAKCLGLDQGAHGNSSIRGFGIVVGHPELTVSGLSEEVGKLHVEGPTTLQVGDKVRIIPNHACSTANLTGYYVSVWGEEVEGLIPVDMRGNATGKNVT